MSPLDFKTISELKQKAKQILEKVQSTGNQVAITINGKPVAVIVPVPKGGFSMFSTLESEKNWNVNKKENEKEEARLQKIYAKKDKQFEKAMKKK